MTPVQTRKIVEVEALADLTALHSSRPWVFVRANETLYRWDYGTDTYVAYPESGGVGVENASGVLQSTSWNLATTPKTIFDAETGKDAAIQGLLFKAAGDLSAVAKTVTITDVASGLTEEFEFADLQLDAANEVRKVDLDGIGGKITTGKITASLSSADVGIVTVYVLGFLIDE